MHDLALEHLTIEQDEIYQFDVHRFEFRWAMWIDREFPNILTRNHLEGRVIKAKIDIGWFSFFGDGIGHVDNDFHLTQFSHLV